MELDFPTPAPPQELSRTAILSTMLATRVRPTRFFLTSNRARPATPNMNQLAVMGTFSPRESGIRTTPETLAVDTVRTEPPVAEAGINSLGAKEQVIPVGRFEQENATGASKDPLSELTVMLVLADPPGGIVAAEGDAARDIFVVP